MGVTEDFSHYPVRQNHRPSRPDVPNVVYVDYGAPDTPQFESLASLVQYYAVYVLLRDERADVFPWWIAAAKGQSH